MRSRLIGEVAVRDSILPDVPRAGAEGPKSGPDPHGHAAMLLVESLLHELISRSVLSVAHAVAVVEVAADVEEELRSEPEGVPTRSSKMILDAVRDSLSTDLPGD